MWVLPLLPSGLLPGSPGLLPTVLMQWFSDDPAAQNRRTAGAGWHTMGPGVPFLMWAGILAGFREFLVVHFLNISTPKSHIFFVFFTWCFGDFNSWVVWLLESRSYKGEGKEHSLLPMKEDEVRGTERRGLGWVKYSFQIHFWQLKNIICFKEGAWLHNIQVKG